MSRLRYTANTSLDGYVNDANGRLDWSAPSDEVLAFITDLERPVGTYLYGRRLYETMLVWESMDEQPDLAPLDRAYAHVWQAAEKTVYSATLEEVSTQRTRLERTFDADAVRDLVGSATSDVSVGGATLAGSALRAGLVDDIHLLVRPVLIGGGTRALPDGIRIDLELIDEHRFADGTVHLHYART